MALSVLQVAVLAAVALVAVSGQSVPAPDRVSSDYISRLLAEYGAADSNSSQGLTPAGLQRLLQQLSIVPHQHQPADHGHSDHADHEHSHREPADHESGLEHGDGGGGGADDGFTELLMHEVGNHHALSHDHQQHHQQHRRLLYGQRPAHDHQHGAEDHGDHQGHDHEEHGHELSADHADYGHDHGDHAHDADQGLELGSGHEDHGHEHGMDHEDHDIHDHVSGTATSTAAPPSRNRREAAVPDTSASDGALVSRTCPDAGQLLTEFGLPANERVSSSQLALLCPALLYHAAADTCGAETDRASQTPAPQPGAAVPPPKLWLFAGLSVLAISLCGLAGVAVVPIMQRVVYRQLLQFLVALAVGTLAGDALLHLLPHALAPHAAGESDGHDHGDGDAGHLDAVLKGLVALVSLVFFFAAERGIGIIHGTCTRSKHKKINKRLADMPGLSREQTEMIERKINDYANNAGANHCFGDRDTLDVLARLNTTHEHDSCPVGDADPEADNHNRTPDCGSQPPTTAASCGSQPSGGHSHKHSEQLKDSEPGTSSTTVAPASAGRAAPRADDNCERFEAEEAVAHSSDFTVIIHEHEHRHHGHTHTHGHIHQAMGGSAAAVAGMVIVGDGLHNFTDGMAIGAAFAAGVASGLSTSVAVFCHELPHEIGDFAVLLQSGMSVRQALFYNIVSSVLCLLGMVLGMVLGNIASFSSWVFAAAAGSFLYIALVDMVPELTAGSGDSGSSPCSQLVLQLIGMSCGAAIMLVIAVYENDLHSLVTVL